MEGDGGWEVEQRVAEMRRLGITKLRIGPAVLEIELGPKPAAPAEEALSGETDEERREKSRERERIAALERRRERYRRELGYAPDDRLLEMLP